MKKYRAIFALLLTIVLPYSATASIVDGLRCHHEGVGALVDGAAPMHHDHAAMMHGQPASATAADNAACDGPVKCDCAHHCGVSAGNAVLAAQSLNVASAGRVELMIGYYAALIADARPSPAFRPPIAALPSAA